ncbi:MAG: hypothetical protein GKR90_26030 [Pseudomonadales bacterium]|nr:hypothetical protein [Pseudomonadales bacterium]
MLLNAGASQLLLYYPVGLTELFCKILVADITSEQLTEDLEMHTVLRCLGGKHATKLLDDSRGAKLIHWPRVWAARTLALVGDTRCVDALELATKDTEWRVRMQAVRAVSLVCTPSRLEEIGASLVSDKSIRVRGMLATCLGRNGGTGSYMLLGTLLRDADVLVRNHAERALARLKLRL